MSKIIIVEDDPSVREELALLLENTSLIFPTFPTRSRRRPPT